MPRGAKTFLCSRVMGPSWCLLARIDDPLYAPHHPKTASAQSIQRTDIEKGKEIAAVSLLERN